VRAAQPPASDIRVARPTGLVALAMQVHWLGGEQVDGDNEDDRGVLEHVAQQIEALTGGVVFSADAAAQIRVPLCLRRFNTAVAG
jgi:hypothetical protein